MNRARRAAPGWLVGLWLLPLLAHAAVQASLDRSRVALGETVTLNLRVADPHGGHAPDLAPLARDFTILGMSSNNSIRIVNGQRSNELTYGIALRPNRVGHVTIPALAVDGEHTAPLQLDVTVPDTRAGANAGKDVFVEVQTDPDVVHVGEQMVLTVRLYYRGALSSASLSPPQVAGAEIRRLGDDINYDTVRSGRSLHVIEQRYAVVPRHAGRMDIQPFVFQGEMVDPSDPDSFFGMGMPVTADSPALKVNVQPPPADWGSSAWLPARDLQLSLEGLPADGKVRVGQPLDLTMTLQASGLPYEALPELSMASVDGAKVYPDKPLTATTASGHWMIGRRQRSFAVVPDQSGTLVLPATTIKWWNVQTGKAEFATIPEHRLTVLPAVGAAGVASAASTGLQPRTAAKPSAAPGVRPVTSRWSWALAALALALVGGWLGRQRARRRRAPPVVPAAVHAGAASAPSARPAAASSRACRVAFMAAATGGTPAEQVACLLAWAKAERPRLSNLSELSVALASEQQRAAIDELQRRHYAGRLSDSATALPLERVFSHGFAWRDSAPRADQHVLPPLYPFKLH